MGKFVVRITEKLRRYVIIEAEDKFEAYEKAEDLCNDSTICLVCEDFYERDIDTIREASEYDEATIKEVY